jgi:multicomponent Na+:H+ antiporter subunit D
MLVFAPILVPLVTAALALLAWRSLRAQEALSIAGATGLLAVAAALLAHVARGGILVAQAGDWPAPFGITFVADLLGALMVAVTAVVALAVLVYSLAGVDERRRRFGFHPLVHVLVAGVCGAFLTGDVFNLFVWFEVMLIASFALVALGGERRQLEGGLTYVVVNLVSSALFLAAVGILYGVAGTLNMAHLAVRLPEAASPRIVDAVGFLFLVAFGIKAAVFPLFFWLPASYPTPPAAIAALFAGLLTKVGVYAIIRFFTLLFAGREIQGLFTVIAALTMATGVLGAVAQRDVRRVLSFHIVSQIGYMLVGLAVRSPLALAGSVFYVVHHIIVKTNLFLVGGAAARLGGSFRLDLLGGLSQRRALAAVFLVPALSLAGTPPLSGFFAKLFVVSASLEAGAWALAATALAVGLLTMFSMSKIWLEAFWKPAPAETSPAGAPLPGAMLAPMIGLAALTALLGAWPSPLLDVSAEVARQLLDPTEYVRAVLGDGAQALSPSPLVRDR